MSDNDAGSASVILERLQREVGPLLVLLSDLDGNIIAGVGNLKNLNNEIVNVLLGSSVAAVNELANMLGESKPFIRHFYEGENYDIYVAAVGEDMLLSLVFDHSTATSRIGAIRLYMRRAVEELRSQVKPPSRILPNGVASQGGGVDDSLTRMLGDAIDHMLE